MVSSSTLPGIFYEKVGIFVPDGGLQVSDFEGCFGTNGFHFPSIFLKIVDFYSELCPSCQTIRSSFGVLFVSSK